MTAWGKFVARFNERSTWTTIYAALMASAPQALGLDWPYNAIVLAAALLGALIPDGKVVEK